MPDQPPFSWDTQSLRFRDSRGRFVANESVKGAVSAYSDALAERIRQDTAKYNAGTIKLATWQRNVQGHIKRGATASGIIAAGGVDRFDQAARDRVQREVDFQYGKFRELVGKVKDGSKTGDTLIANAAMYAGTATRSYEATRRTVNGVQYREEKRVLSAGGKHCDPCINHASKLWQPVGTLPEIGDECSCLSNCGCSFVYQLRRKAGEPPAEIKPRESEPESTPTGGLTEYGPSRAAVSHPGHSRAVARQSARSLFGPRATLQDFASAVGAPDDARVEVVPDFERADITITGKGFTAIRRIEKGIVSGKLTINNESFYVEPGSQGKGIGAAVFGRQVEQAGKLGVDQLKTFAAGNAGDTSTVGSKVWTRFGYNGPLPKGLPDPPNNESTFEELMMSKEGREWWDRNRIGVDVAFDLKEGSYSRQVWDGYRRDKEARTQNK